MLDSVRTGLSRAMTATHPYRAAFWLVMTPIALVTGWAKLIEVVFLYSAYANFAGDIAAWEAASD